MIKQFEMEYEEFRRLTAREQYADDFAQKHRDYILDYPFQDAYIVKLIDGYYRVDYVFDYGLGVFFDGIRKMTKDEWQEVFHEYEKAFEKIKHIQNEQ